MSKLKCPHCGERIDTKKLKVGNRKRTDFFDAYDQDDEDIEKLLRSKNIEFGQMRTEVKNTE